MQLWGEEDEEEGRFTQKSIRFYQIFLLPYGNEKVFFTILTIGRKTASVTHNSANFTSGSVFRSLSTTEALGAPTGVSQRKKKRKLSADAWGMILGSDGLMFLIHSLVLCTRGF